MEVSTNGRETCRACADSRRRESRKPKGRGVRHRPRTLSADTSRRLTRNN
jgi:hypothetical protein